MLILASQSPRRRELLEQLKVPFSTHVVDIDESVLPQESPFAYVSRLAEQKAQTAFEQGHQQNTVLGSDTSVIVNQTILGKPSDFADFADMMAQLSDNYHQVLTAIAMIDAQQRKMAVVETKVKFKALTDAEIKWYWSTGEPADKAGGYGIQGIGGQFVTDMQGSYSAVVGLPLYETSQLLQEMGVVKYEC